MSMTTSEPKLEHRSGQPYVAIPIRVPMKEWGKTTVLVPEIFGWLEQKGIEPAGTPFYRYLVIGDMDMDGDAPFHLEVGVPVARAVCGDGRVVAGAIPGGSYVTLVHHGHPDRLVESCALLESWAAEQGLAWKNRREGADEVWGGRFEFYLTDPAVEPDLEKWSTEIAYLVKDDAATRNSRATPTSTTGESGLPGNLSAPAQRALAGAGISTLDDLTRFSKREILQLHGVGPNTLPPLEAALAETGRSFADDK